MQEIYVYIIGVLLAVIGFYLSRTMVKVEASHDLGLKNETKILLLQQREEMTKVHIDDKFDAIQKSIGEIKELVKQNNNRI